MSGQLSSAIIAIALGVVIGVLLFVPFVAVSYRRHGRLGFGRFLVWAGALVYFWAIWTYTLLPLPDGAYTCAGVELDPLTLVRGVRSALAMGLAGLTSTVFLQIALNVLLFVPLGFFLRVLGGRGIVVALLAGLGVSLLIETTQLTGVWGVYPCAYRVFDVGDLITNTSGALLGSLIALVVPRRHRGFDVAPDADLPHPVTRGRRMLAMLCDGLALSLVSVAISTAATAVRLYLLHDHAARGDDELALLLGTVGAAGIWLLVTLITGQTPGDAAVRLRYGGGPLPAFFARLLRWAGGYAGITLLGLAWGPAHVVLVPVSILLLLFTRHGRGLPGVLSGQDLDDARALSAEPNPQPIPITNR